MANKLNLNIDQGADFSTTINVTNINGMPIDLTTYTAQSQMRRHYTSSNAVSFSVSISNSNIILSLNSYTSSLLSNGRYVYDVEIISSSNVVSRVVEGIITVSPNVTR